MKQYDKIYVDYPTSSMEPPDVRLKSGHPLRIIDNAIVITVQELKAVWQAGERAKVLENNPNAKYIDFESYMVRKGITI